MITDSTELRKLRELNKITQVELAEVVGLHPTAITMFEAGKLDCRLSTIQLINDGIDIILNSRKAKNTGAIIKNDTDFKNTCYRAIIGVLQGHEASGKYKGNSHHLAQGLVELLAAEFKVTQKEAATYDYLIKHDGD